MFVVDTFAAFKSARNDRRMFEWFERGTRRVIMAILTFAVPVGLLRLFPNNAETLFVTAVFWEPLGVGALVWGILETRRRFQRKIFTPRLRAWSERLQVALGKTQTIRLETIGSTSTLFRARQN